MSSYGKNEKGVTLVEVLIALVILLLVFIGLTQSALLSIDGNIRNLLRDEAIRIADERMNGCLCSGRPYSGGTTCPAPPSCYSGLRTISFSGTNGLTSLATGAWTPTPLAVKRNFRNLTKTYTVCWRITTLDTETIQIEVAVGWNHKDELARQAPTDTEYVHQITTLRRS